MTLADGGQAAIRNLYAQYAFAFDEADAAGWASLFAPDGRFMQPGLPDLVGREQLRDFVLQRRSAAPDMRHFTANVEIIESGAGAAHGRAYVLVLRIEGEELQLRTMGEYDDDLVYHDGLWRFQTRRYRTWLPPRLANAAFVFA